MKMKARQKRLAHKGRAKRGLSFGRLSLITFLIVVFVLGALAIWHLRQSEHDEGESKTPSVFTITQKDHVMTPDSAYDYGSRVIGPILDKYIADGNELPALRQRLTKFATMLGTGQMEYETVPAFFPVKSSNFLAHLDFNPITHKPLLYLFVPAVQQAQKGRSEKGFADYIAVLYAHEMIHWENNTEFPLVERMGKAVDPDSAREEAIAWGITIVEIANPLLAQGRLLGTEWDDMSKQLAKLGNNYRHPAWILAFAKKVQQASSRHKRDLA